MPLTLLFVAQGGLIESFTSLCPTSLLELGMSTSFLFTYMFFAYNARFRILEIMTKGWEGWDGPEGLEAREGLGKATKGFGGADLRVCVLLMLL